MAERKKMKKKGKEGVEMVCQVPLKPSKDEYAVAKYLRKNLPVKRTKFLLHTVEFFTASKAIDMLLESPWASDKSKSTLKFTTRESVVDFMDLMLRHKLFHRARRVPITARDLRGKALKKFQEEQEKLKEMEKQKPVKDSKKKKAQREEGDGDNKAVEDPSDAENLSKKEESDACARDDDKEAKCKEGKAQGPKRRIKLEMHLHQVFVDGNDAYVWLYDPTPWYYWLLSILLVLGAIALCLFPLWPSSVRKGVYYLSLAGAGFLIFILGLAVVRMVVFAFIWMLTLGRHHLWLLPNLTEDVGFLASFWPLFQYDYKGPNKKSKQSDDEEEESSGSESESEGEDASKNSETKKPQTDDKSKSNEAPGDDLEPRRKDEDDDGSQSSRNSQTDKEFEIIGTEEATE